MYKIIPHSNFSGPKTVYDWYISCDKIDFEPRYQRRGLVWPKSTKQLLIDSILNSFDIPKFYIHYNSHIEKNPLINPNSNSSLYSIIDGKQRLNAIFEFINNQFPVGSNFKFLDNNIHADIRGLYYRDIATQHPSIRRIIDNYELDVVYIITDDVEIVKSLFRRLNSGVSIKNPEIRMAIFGQLAEIINDNIDNNKFINNRLCVKNNGSNYFNIYSKMVFIEYCIANYGEMKDLNKKNIDLLFISNPEPNKNIKHAIFNTERTLKLMSQIFIDKDPLLNKIGMIILYYAFTSHIINKSKDISLPDVRKFLVDFENLRKKNRALIRRNEADNDLLEFDRLTQQGSTKSSSLTERVSILGKYFYKTDNN